LAAVLFPVAVEPASAQTAELILRMELGTHNAGIFSIAIDPSNSILVTGSEDKTAQVWDISANAKLLRILHPPIRGRTGSKGLP
jgi:WD40 repeat protein